MKGTILDFSIQTNQGIISAEDGKRYNFSGNKWDVATPPQAGMQVEFEAQAAEVTKILPTLQNQKMRQTGTQLLTGFYIVSTILAIIAGPAVIILPFGIYRVGFIETSSGHESGAAVLAVLLVVAIFVWIFGTITFLRLIYKMWDAIQDGSARTTPEKAVALLFVPIFNSYWLFEITMGWLADFDKYVSNAKIQIEPIPIALKPPVLLMSIITSVAMLVIMITTMLVPAGILGAISISQGDMEAIPGSLMVACIYTLVSLGIFTYIACARLNKLYKITSQTGESQ